MAPLYKRYIPPTPSAKTTVSPAIVAEPISKAKLVVSETDTPKKRKRERSEEEIAERKAKKLKKKGIDPAIVSKDPKFDNALHSNKKAAIQSTDVEDDQDSIVKSHSEFAHVKNAKKRHKLEKEARKAKKTVTQNGHDINPVTASSKPESTDEPTPFDRSNEQREQPILNGTATAKSLDAEEKDVVSGAGSGELPKKRKTKKHSNEEQPAVEAVVDGNANINGSVEVTPAQLQSKRWRHKLEAVLEDAQGGATVEEEDVEEHLRKHSGVMNRFSQSKSISKMSQQASHELTEPDNPTVVLDLTPLPQPEKATTPDFKPDPSLVPKWLAEPTIVSSTTQRRFDELKLHSKLVQQLHGLGFKEAMPVQQALIPLLLPPGIEGAKHLPGTESVLPDVAVGAPTGSGKTIAYLVPVIESLKGTAEQGKLKALVIVPTRELVMQVAAVVDSLARGTGIKVGMMTGTGSFKDEQSRVVSCGRRYDPEAHRQLMTKAQRRNYPPAEDSTDFEEYLNEIESQNVKEDKRLQDLASVLIDHVPTYGSAVDVLIATPGRLLEHLDKTLGFSLAHLDWLILDEADKLVDQQYDGFLETVNQQLSQLRRLEEQDAREKFLRAQGSWNEQKERRVRKVVLSATMTRDISKLMELKLRRPQLLLVQSEAGDESVRSLDEDGRVKPNPSGSHEFELPPALVEYCVHVGDGSEKPLYFVELVEKKILGGAGVASRTNNHAAPKMETAESSHSSSDSSSTSSSEDESSSDASSEEYDATAEASKPHRANGTTASREDVVMEGVTDIHPDRAALLDHFSIRRKSLATTPVVLVFVSSTESANRLAHLLGILKPAWSSYIRAMTRADSKQNAIQSASSSDPVIVISTDRAARGLDTIANKAITHVVQYDIPRSATDYVHRVGRTARAGRHGEAWTLFTHSEARWFNKGISKLDSIKRAEPVEKVKVTLEGGEGQRDQLARALEGMREDVFRK